MEQSRLYNHDMIDKAHWIKDQAIEIKTLENHEKTKEMSEHLSDINLKNNN